MQTINIAKDFSKFPAGRNRRDGNYSGEEFRVKHLAPALEKGGEVVVELDGTLGYGSSFLEEAFGGLIREHNFTSEELLQRLKLKSSRPSYLKEIEGYIIDAGRV